MMTPIYEFKTIQVELTNACVHSCSNCTRFCGHHKKPFFMEWDTFKNAVDSLEDWPRLVGIMGGEPTLHPQFERFVNYAYQKHPMQYEIGGGAQPTKSLSKYVIDANAIKTGPLNKFKGLGLWSTVSDKYYQHYELIQDKFVFQCINDHTASSRHQPWLMTRKEFGISDEEWIPIRNNCWWHRTLNSPSITPKGAFFCEVAAAMDILFDGPGGWKVEKGWWKRDYDDYQDQLHWCEMCCGAFITFDRDANEECDDVSPVMYNKLLQMDSPKAKKEGGVIVHDIGAGGEIKTKPRKNMLLYQDNDELRFTDKNKCLYPKRIHGIVWEALGTADSGTLSKAQQMFDGVSVINAQSEDAFSKLAKCIQGEQDWVAILPQSCELKEDFRTKMDTVIFNPGTLHKFVENSVLFFNVGASCLKTAGFAALKNLQSIEDLCAIWSAGKIAILDENYHEVQGPDLENWIENIKKKGIIEFNYIMPHINDMIVRRRLEPEISSIVSSSLPVEEKISALDGVYHQEIQMHVLANKIKTAIHNLLAAALKETPVLELVQKLETKSKSFCTSYALSLLATGDDKAKYLTDCVVSQDNRYFLGLDSLKRYYDYFDMEKNKQNLQLCGTLVEIVQLAGSLMEFGIAGNRYNGKSISMILSAAGIKANCFVDDDRVGSYFDGLPTLSVREYAEEQKDTPLIMAQHADEFEEITMLAFERLGVKAKMFALHVLSYGEMAMCRSMAELRIAQKSLDDLKGITLQGNYIAKCREILSR